MRPNAVKSKLLKNQPVFGAEVSFGSPLIAESFALAGFDFIQVDHQHGEWSPERALCAFKCICLGGAVPMARVQQNNYGAIGALVDLGALGIVVPMVNTPDQAMQAVRAILYPPPGHRSYGAIGVAVYGELPDYVEHIRKEILLVVQIETREAVDRVEEILSVEGVDACMVGPNDLSLSMGVPPWSEEHESAIEAVLTACRKVGKIPGIAAWGTESNAPSRRAAQGFLFIQATGDREIVAKGGQEVLVGLQALRAKRCLP